MTAVRSLMPVALDAVERAADTIRTTAPGILTAKGDRDMASEVDYRVEREIRDLLTTAAPAIGFLGEENGATGNPDVFWALDPVDGTANFVHGIPLCAVSLALIEHGTPTLGVIALPFLGGTYHAEHGGGAHEGTRQLHVSTTTDLRDAIVAIGDYAVGEGADQKNERRLALTAALAARVQRIRMLGSAAIDLLWVADGKLDASITLANHPWDTAAGVLFVREAGGCVMDLPGKRHEFTSVNTIGTNSSIDPELSREIHETEPPR